MSYDAWNASDDDPEAGRLVPLYVLVNGRTVPRNLSLDLATQVIALPLDSRRLEPEYEQIVHLCSAWISIAEIGAYLHLPLAVTKVMVDALLEQGYLSVAAPAQHSVADRSLLETVLAGLENL